MWLGVYFAYTHHKIIIKSIFKIITVYIYIYIYIKSAVPSAECSEVYVGIPLSPMSPGLYPCTI